MDSNRAKTLEALEEFIESQKILLTRTQSDIVKLQKLRKEIISHPIDVIKNIDQKLQDSAFRLSNQCDTQLSLPRELDWSIYDTYDPKAFQHMAVATRQKYGQRNQPLLHQCSELSELQKFVKEARRSIVDPILADFEYVSEPELELSESDPEEAMRERERAKLRELKKRKIHSWGGLKLPSRGLAGVYIRRDVEDESVDVDVTLDDDPPVTHHSHSLPDVDIPPSIFGVSIPSYEQQCLTSSPRRRRPSTKIRHQNDGKPQTMPVPSEPKSKLSLSSYQESVQQVIPTKSGTDKPKSETYKQVWSVSEQHLLEQLLEQIPDGEKNRWKKISRAMNGRRTPRQVASRVQKYFEKLKRFGIG